MATFGVAYPFGKPPWQRFWDTKWLLLGGVPPSVALLLHFCCTSVALPLHFCCTSVALPLHFCCTSVAFLVDFGGFWDFCCTSVALPLHFCCTSVAFLVDFGRFCNFCCTSVALLLHFRCTSVALPLHFCCTSVALPLHFCCTSVALLLHFRCTSVALLLHFCCTSVALLLHFCCTSVALLLHFCLHFCCIFGGFWWIVLLGGWSATEGKSDTRHVLPSTFAKHFCQPFLTRGKSCQAHSPSTFAKHFCRAELPSVNLTLENAIYIWLLIVCFFCKIVFVCSRQHCLFLSWILVLKMRHFGTFWKISTSSKLLQQIWIYIYILPISYIQFICCDVFPFEANETFFSDAIFCAVPLHWACGQTSRDLKRPLKSGWQGSVI